MDRPTLTRDQIQPFFWKTVRQWILYSWGPRNPNGETPQGIASRAAIDMVSAGLLPNVNPAVEALLPEEKSLFEEMMWDLATQGVLHLGAPRSQAWEHLYKPSEYGQELARHENDELTPYDPDGYIQALQDATGGLDTVMKTYLGEALSTFRHRNFLASLVMLGAASEHALLTLCKAYDPNTNDNASAATLFKALMLDVNNKGRAFKKEIANATQDDWEERLEGGFNIIRQSRNGAGHPARMAPVTRVAVRDRFLIFSSYIETVFALIRFFKTSRGNA